MTDRIASSVKPEALAFQLRSDGAEGTLYANATVLSPRLVVTPQHVVHGRSDQRFVLATRGRELPAHIVAEDAQADFALLEPDGNLGHDGPVALASTPPPPGTRWDCVFWMPGRELRTGFGKVGNTVTIEGRPYIELDVVEPRKPPAISSEAAPESSPLAGLSGAPIVAKGRLIGIAARVDGEHWYAISVAAMAASTVTDAVRALMGGTIEAAPDRDQPPEFSRLSVSARRALSHAESIRRHLKSSAVHMEHLIAGLYEKTDGPTQKAFQAAGLDADAVLKLLSEIAERPLPRPGQYPFADVDAIPAASAHVRRALVEARRIADARGAAAVQSRHLIYGALSLEDCHVVQALRDKGVKRDDIPLTDPSPAPRLAELLAGLHTDSTKGEDLLDLKQEVAALCGVLAAANVDPPISVGLFGDWGSGKSFFMTLMEEQIKEYAKGARADRQKGKRNPFCEEVVQLKFNAWHYADADLWASLASEIFERLSEKLDAQAVPDGSALSPRDHLLAAASSARDVLAAAERQQAAAAKTLQETEQRLATLQKRDGEIEAGLSATAIVREAVKAASEMPQVREELDRAAEKLGLRSADRTASDVRAELLELGQAAGYFRGVWRGLVGGGPRLWLLSLAVIGLVLVWVPLLMKHGVLVRLGGLVAGATATLASLGALLRPIVVQVRDAMKTVQQVQEANQAAIEERRRQIEVAGENERAANKTQVEQAQGRVAQARKDVDEIQRRVDEMRADRQMARFLRERFASADYTKQFGSIARARNDFERLCALFKQARSEARQPSTGPSESPLRVPRIDRIVIYIDDLDRCPEDKVVDVLQAVHLLLAFDLFVVVVGVDPRWLLHSLRQHSKAFQEPDDDDDTATLDEEKIHWQSTPFSYLEKIFQIPFTLRPMDSGGYVAMVDSLVRPMKDKEEVAPATKGPEEAASATSPASPPSGAAGPSPAMPAAPAAGASASAPDSSPASPAQGAAPSDVPPPEPDREYLEISTSESDYMKLMFPLIPSPRSTNRYVNVYRLLRATVPPAARESFESEGGDHRVVLLLLAMLTGNPAETTEIIRDLLQGVPADAWWARLEDYRKRAVAAVPATGVPDLEAQAAAEGWRQLFERLDTIAKTVRDPWSAQRFKEWAPRVARYSFQSGRVLLAARAGSSGAPRPRAPRRQRARPTRTTA